MYSQLADRGRAYFQRVPLRPRDFRMASGVSVARVPFVCAVGRPALLATHESDAVAPVRGYPCYLI